MEHLVAAHELSWGKPPENLPVLFGSDYLIVERHSGAQLHCSINPSTLQLSTIFPLA